MLHTEHGCDSALYLTLTVNERIQVGVDSMTFACADAEELYITFNIAAGVYDSLLIDFDTPLLRDTTIYVQTNSVQIPYSASITPGHYKATLSFYQFCCGVYTESRDFDIRFPSSIVEQKWNDVLTLLSPSANGGYTFTAFQWYKNGLPIEGETHSYLYHPLDFSSTYYVELTREDGVTVATCPIQPVQHEDKTKYPTIVTANQIVRIHTDNPTKIYIYSAFGQLVHTYSLTAGDAVFQTPAQAGIYIIRYEED